MVSWLNWLLLSLFLTPFDRSIKARGYQTDWIQRFAQANWLLDFSLLRKQNSKSLGCRSSQGPCSFPVGELSSFEQDSLYFKNNIAFFLNSPGLCCAGTYCSKRRCLESASVCISLGTVFKQSNCSLRSKTLWKSFCLNFRTCRSALIKLKKLRHHSDIFSLVKLSRLYQHKTVWCWPLSLWW